MVEAAGGLAPTASTPVLPAEISRIPPLPPRGGEGSTATTAGVGRQGGGGRVMEESGKVVAGDARDSGPSTYTDGVKGPGINSAPASQTEDHKRSRRVRVAPEPPAPLRRRSSSMRARRNNAAERRVQKFRAKLDACPAWERFLVTILQSWPYTLLVCAVAVLLCATDTVVEVLAAGGAAVWPGYALAGVLFAVTVLDTTLHSVEALRRVLDLEGTHVVLIGLDALALACFAAGLAITGKVFVPFLTGLTTVSSVDYARTELARESQERATSMGLLLLPLFKLVTALHRKTSWERSLYGRRADATRPARSLRRVVLLLGCVTVVLFVALAQIQLSAGQMWHVNPTQVDMSPPILVNVVAHGGVGDGASAEAAIEETNELSRCAKALWVERDGAVVAGTPGSSGVDLIVWSDDNTTRGFFSLTCTLPVAKAALLAKMAVVAAEIIALVLLHILGHSQVVRPLVRLLSQVLWMASHLDESGMLLDKDAYAGDFTAEGAVDRVVKSIKLLLKASFRGGNVMRRMLAQAKEDGGEHDAGLMEIYGVAPKKITAATDNWAAKRETKHGTGSQTEAAWDALFRRPSRRETARDPLQPVQSMALHQNLKMSATSSAGGDRERRGVRSRRPPEPPMEEGRMSAPRVSAGPVLVDAGVSSQHSHLENDASESAEVDAWRQALTHLGTPNWDVWGVRKDLLPSMVMEMFRSLGLVDAAGPMVSVVRGTSVGSSRRMAGTAAGGAEGESGAGTPVGGAAGAGTRFARPRNHSSGAPARGMSNLGDSKTPRRMSGHPSVNFVHAGTLMSFLNEVQRRYLDNPYHRWEHAVDVTHTTFMMLKTCRSFRKHYLTKRDIFCLMVAAVAHDMGHRGVSNAHLVKTGDILAMTYNDQSPQEHMHVSALFQLCQKVPGANIFENFPKADFEECRRLIIELILDTDMACHFKRVAELEALLAKAAAKEGVLVDSDSDSDSDGPFGLESMTDHALSPGRPTPRYDPSDVRQIMLAMLHAADLGNSVKPVHLHARWSVHVIEEFFQEAGLQKELGMTSLAFMDPAQCYVPVTQLDFLDFVARPLFSVISRLLPEVDYMLGALAKNYAFWCSVLAEDQFSKNASGLVSHPSATLVQRRTANSSEFNMDGARARQAAFSGALRHGNTGLGGMGGGGGGGGAGAGGGGATALVMPEAYADNEDQLRVLSAAIPQLRAMGRGITDAALALVPSEKKKAFAAKLGL